MKDLEVMFAASLTLVVKSKVFVPCDAPEPFPPGGTRNPVEGIMGTRRTSTTP